MITIKSDKLNFSLLIKSFESNKIFIIEIGFLEWNNLSFLGIVGLEPGRTWWVDNCIIVEHSKLDNIQISE